MAQNTSDWPYGCHDAPWKHLRIDFGQREDWAPVIENAGYERLPPSVSVQNRSVVIRERGRPK